MTTAPIARRRSISETPLPPRPTTVAMPRKRRAWRVIAGAGAAVAVIPVGLVASFAPRPAGAGGPRRLAPGGYPGAATRASVIGHAPAAHPRCATLVVLDENNLRYGGAVSAPVFAEITQFALQQYGVNASDLSDTQFNAAQATAKAGGNSCGFARGPRLAAKSATA